MNKGYIIVQFENFGSVFSEPKWLELCMKTLLEERKYGEKFILEWAGWGWIIHQ